jgi:hypothetical protein
MPAECTVATTPIPVNDAELASEVLIPQPIVLPVAPPTGHCRLCAGRRLGALRSPLWALTFTDRVHLVRQVASTLRLQPLA